MTGFKLCQRRKRTPGLRPKLGFQGPQVAPLPQLAAMLVHHPQVHEEMRREHVHLDVGAGDIHTGLQTHQLEHGIHQRATAKGFGHIQRISHFLGRLRQWHQARARALVQGFDERLDLLFQHARHQPFAAFFAHLVQYKQRHCHRQSVFAVAGFMQVGGGTIHTAQTHGFRKRIGGDTRCLVAHELITRQLEQVRLGVRFMPVPALKTVGVVNVGGQLLVIKGVDQFVVDQHVLASRFVFQLLHLFDQPLIGCEEGQRRFPLPAHQRFADKNLTRRHRVDAAVIHPSAAVNQQAIQGGPLQRHHVGGFFLPVRVDQLLLEQMPADLLQPLRVNIGDAPAKQAGGFHQFRRHDPAAGLLLQVRTGVRKELDGPRTQVFIR